MRQRFKIVLLVFIGLIIFSCGTKEARKATNNESEESQIVKYIRTKNLRISQSTNSGLRFILIKENPSGISLKKGQTVKVNYSGKLLSGEKFDEGSFNFILGIGQVIPGFDQGIAKLKVGEKGTLIFPSSLGYGAAGAGSDIPPNSPLVFDIEVVAAR